MTAITSRHHPLVKEFREAAHSGTVMLLDGWHLLTEALNTGMVVESLAVCGPTTVHERAVIDRALSAHARVVAVSGAVVRAMSPVRSPTGVVATARRPVADTAAMLAPAPALVLAGIGIQDPGNTGAMIRSAAAAGATGVMVDAATADPWGWKALRASMGGVFHLPVIRTGKTIETLAEWRASGLSVVAAVPHGGVSIYTIDLTRPVVVVIGGEGAGLPQAVLAAADARASIPMNAAVESLNVAVAAALILYEAKRQRAR